MLQSMTGFGKATGTYSNKKISVEIKSLNSKNLDLHIRMLPVYREREIGLRKKIGKVLDRGKIECVINVETNGDNKEFTINKELAGNYYSQIMELANHLELKSEDVLNTILKMPEIFTSETEDLDDEEWNYIEGLVEQALEKHIEFRNSEGAALKEEFELRINNIRDAFAKVPEFEDVRIEGIKKRIETNLEEFIGGVKVDKNRFEQELIYYLEKIDIAEEKQRLSKHLDFFLETLSQDSSQGKKLGFISQEIGREINTLGSKAYHPEMQKLVVQMKDDLEKIKEQVLNTL
ncbi:YicC family protein [Crocinitomix catalasitica]|nr:YicC family protein [Crocinitomix catalasitica]